MTIMQAHVFHATDPDHPDKCTQKDDISDTLCFRRKIHHLPVAFSTETNPYLTSAREAISRTMREDMKVALRFATQYRAWENDRSRNLSERSKHVADRQLWEARVRVLCEALRGIGEASDDD